MGEYTLRELAEAGGEKERTIRYYQQLGLLRQPGQIGPGAHYDEDDRLRLRLIRQLQSEGRSLAEVARHFATLDEEAIRDEALRHGSALDYVRSVLGEAPARVAPSTAPPSLLSAGPNAPAPAAVPPSDASRWERIEIVAGIELHVQQPISAKRRRAISAYIDRARNELERNNS
ncbi:MAG: helix-turn-helix domain-containing protein [Chloroflexota bacterium]|nr:helix-turn-helix domain-containing protein [Chloroflexota bacterium]